LFICKTQAVRVGIIETNLQETGLDMDWTDLAQDRDMWQDIPNMVKLWV